MRILHVIQTIDPKAGGPAEAVRTLMGFGELGYTGEVVTLDPPDSPFLKGIPFKVNALGPCGNRYGFSLKLYRWIADNHCRFDGVVVNGLWSFCGPATWLALDRRSPYMIFSHGMLDPYFKHAFPRKHLKKWIYWILVEYWVLRRARHVLFTTHEESSLARTSFWLHRWKGYVVPYGCSRPPPASEAMHRAFLVNVPGVLGKRFLLYLGRIHRKKGCDMLIRSFVKHAASDPELHLVMAGPDQQGWAAELQAELETAGLEDRVLWPGMLRGDLKWGAFYAAEAFILPSHQENFGIAVAESLACGTPVLLADKVNIAGQVEKDGAGLMEPDTPEGTDTLIQRWIAMPEMQRQRMREHAILTFRSRYDMEQNALTILRLFKAIG